MTTTITRKLRDRGRRLPAWLLRQWRFRFALWTVIAPTIVLCAATTWPTLLGGLLLLRGGIDDATSLFADVAFVTWISAVTVALGLAIARVIALHGDARLDRRANPTKDVEAADLQDDSNSQSALPSNGKTEVPNAGWPAWKTTVWLALSLPLPAYAAYHTLSDLSVVYPDDARDIGMRLGAWATVGLVVGLAAAALSLVLLSLIREAIVGHHSHGAGLLVGERLASRVFARIGSDRATEARPLGIRLGCWIPGFNDRVTGRVLPGHVQLLVMFLISIAVYLWTYSVSMWAGMWHASQLPSVFYLMVVLYCVSAIISLTAFILDRFRFPTILALVAYVAVTYLFRDSDRYFAISPPLAVQDVQEVDLDSAQGIDAERHPLVAALSARPSLAEDYPKPPTLVEVFADREFPQDAFGKRTMIIVTASGGGIQAASWTAAVLTGLDERFPYFRDSIGFISSVSGGSVGTMYYIAHGRRFDVIRRAASESSLESVSWGVAFPDFARRVVPFSINPEIDRGFALEASWWNRLGPTAGNAQLMRDVRLRDLIEPIKQGVIPPVIFNATTVETGQRVMISPLRCGTATGSRGDVRDAVDRVNNPIDFLAYYEPLFQRAEHVNPRLTTAVRLSASFAYVTPVARPYSVEQDLLKQDLDPSLKRRLAMHYCDGGYADNSGVVTAVRLLNDLIVHYRSVRERPPFDRVLIVRIEPFPPLTADFRSDNTGLASAWFGPVMALTAARKSTQHERADLELGLLLDKSVAELDKLQNEVGHNRLRSSLNVSAAAQEASLVFSSEPQLVSADLLDKIDRVVSASKEGMNELDGAVANLSDQEMRDSLKAIKDDTSRQSLQTLVFQVQEHKAAVAEEEQAKETAIEIDVAMFQFGTQRAENGEDEGATDQQGPMQVEGATDLVEESSGGPPLSWILSRADRFEIEQAWLDYKQTLNAAEVASASDAPSTSDAVASRKGYKLIAPHVLAPNSLGLKTKK